MNHDNVLVCGEQGSNLLLGLKVQHRTSTVTVHGRINMLQVAGLVLLAAFGISWMTQTLTVEAWIPPQSSATAGVATHGSHSTPHRDVAFVFSTQPGLFGFSQNFNQDDNVGNDSTSLAQCVCLVTGASRGIGKGIALELGRCGATVYVTGTSSNTTAFDDVDPNPRATEAPGTVQDTAREVTQAGGQGIPVVCNHADDAQVQQLVQQIQHEHGRLDILVNNAFRLPSDGAVEQLQQKFWQLGAEAWDSLHTVGLRSH